MKKLAILGLGHIGSYVLNTLSSDTNFSVSGYDLSTGHNLDDSEIVRKIVSEVDGVLASTPFYLNKKIAQNCAYHNVDYFDLTESVDVTTFVNSLTEIFPESKSKYVTQCGLAPGMVSVIAANLAKEFGVLENIEIRVGALPKNSNNQLGYYRTWNTEGLINEYIHSCLAIKNRQLVELDPVADFETVVFDGLQLEAANTSGGIGSLTESYGSALNVNYKTLRYPGHWDIIKFLKNDLGLDKEFRTYVDLFNKYVPTTTDDVVYILINVSGLIDGKFCIKQYHKKILGTDTSTAIQISTASGILSVLDSWCRDEIPVDSGRVKQEQLNFQSIWNSKYSSCYRD